MLYNREHEVTIMPEYLSTKQAADELKVSSSRVLKLIKSGRLPAKKFGRDWQIDPDDLALVAVRKPGYPEGKPRTGYKDE